jgi:hypothetical protein
LDVLTVFILRIFIDTTFVPLQNFRLTEINEGIIIFEIKGKNRNIKIERGIIFSRQFP